MPQRIARLRHTGSTSIPRPRYVKTQSKPRKRGQAWSTGLTALDVLTKALRSPGQTEAEGFSGPCPCPILGSPGNGHLLGILSVLQAVLDSGTKVSVVGRDWARPWLRATYPPSWVSPWCPVMPDQEEVTRLGDRVGTTHAVG